jgi:hypothetical protein
MVTSVERRRHWSKAEKNGLIQGRWAPAPSEVTCAAEIHTSQLFRHRQQLCERTQLPTNPDRYPRHRQSEAARPDWDRSTASLPLEIADSGPKILCVLELWELDARYAGSFPGVPLG